MKKRLISKKQRENLKKLNKLIKVLIQKNIITKEDLE